MAIDFTYRNYGRLYSTNVNYSEGPIHDIDLSLVPRPFLLWPGNGANYDWALAISTLRLQYVYQKDAKVTRSIVLCLDISSMVTITVPSSHHAGVVGPRPCSTCIPDYIGIIINR